MGYRVELGGPERVALINLRTDPEGLPAVEQALGVALPAPGGIVAENEFITVFGLGPDEWLVRTRNEEEAVWLARLEAVATGSFAAVVLVSDAWRVFTLTGPGSLDVLSQATGIDLHPSAFPTGHAVRAAFARIGALIHRLDDQPSFDVYVDATLARYAGQWLEAAGGAGDRTAERRASHCEAHAVEPAARGGAGRVT